MTRLHRDEVAAAFEDELEAEAPASPKARQRPASPERAASAAAAIAGLTDLSDTHGEFKTSYTPARFEKEWLRDSLRPFYDERSIVDVLALVKGGKEANVYCCRAHPALGGGLLAAKVYRPQQFRNLSNDALYREGRRTLGGDGRPIKENDSRVGRALRKKTAFGAEVKHIGWLMHEVAVLNQLQRAGAAVPEAIAAGENAILMTYCGDETSPAPVLSSVALAPAEATTLFDQLWQSLEIMLAEQIIHADLSAYNILYWQARPTLIDFPQAINCHVNPRAYAILRRDITRLCQYFARQGIVRDPIALTNDLWTRHVAASVDESEALLPLR